MGSAQGGRPAGAQVLKVRLARLDPIGDLGVAGVRAHHNEVDWQADSEIRSHGRIHGDQPDLERVKEVGVVADRAVENRLSIFMLTYLKIRCVDRPLDEISSRVDHEELKTRAL